MLLATRRVCPTSLELLEEAANKLEDLPSQLKATAEVINLHVRILVADGEFLKASFLAETLSLSDPVSFEKAMAVAQYRLAAKVPHEALEWLRKCEHRWQHNGEYHYLLAQCYSLLGDRDEMKSHLNTALAINNNLRSLAIDDPCFEFLFGEI